MRAGLRLGCGGDTRFMNELVSFRTCYARGYDFFFLELGKILEGVYVTCRGVFDSWVCMDFGTGYIVCLIDQLEQFLGRRLMDVSIWAWCPTVADLMFRSSHLRAAWHVYMLRSLPGLAEQRRFIFLAVRLSPRSTGYGGCGATPRKYPRRSDNNTYQEAHLPYRRGRFCEVASGTNLFVFLASHICGGEYLACLGDAGIEERGQIGEKRVVGSPRHGGAVRGSVGVAQRGPPGPIIAVPSSLFLVVGLGGGGSDSCPAALPPPGGRHASGAFMPRRLERRGRPAPASGATPSLPRIFFSRS